MAGNYRVALCFGVCLALGSATVPARAQSRFNHERRLRDLEGVTQELVELGQGQGRRWSEMEAALQAQQTRLAQLDAQMGELRLEVARRGELLQQQQDQIDKLSATVARLRTKLVLTQIGRRLPEARSRSTVPSFAATFRARRPPASPSGTYYRPAITGNERLALRTRPSAYEWP